MNQQDVIAIDIHSHAEVSCWYPFDAYGEEYDRAADKYFRSSNRPTIAETITHYRTGCKPEVVPGISKGNAVRLLGL